MVLRRIASILLLLTWCTLGTGLLAHLHNLQHQLEDRRAGLLDHHGPAHHDETNCRVHAMLAAPMVSQTMMAPVLDVGPLIEVTQPAHESAVMAALPLSQTCRGPPASL